MTRVVALDKDLIITPDDAAVRLTRDVLGNTCIRVGRRCSSDTRE